MKQIQIMVLSKRKMKSYMIKFAASTILAYLLICLYFTNHYFFNTYINGVNVSLKAHGKAAVIISNYVKEYKLLLYERNGETEVITSQDIQMKYNQDNNISQIYSMQKSLFWFGSLIHSNKYNVKELYTYDNSLLGKKINELNCLTGKIIEPQNSNFKYIDGSYELVKESYGTKIKKDNLINTIKHSLSLGRTELDLNQMKCYENPKYTITSERTLRTLKQLNQYVTTKITYQFGSVTEQLDGSTIHQWISVDENLEIILSKKLISEYIDTLCKKYNTVGIIREFQSSTGKKIELKGGLYGWKIDCNAESEALFNHIRHGDIIRKEPIYLQRALSREGNEIGDTYLEINITTQHLWFYKDGKLIVQGSVVTGNPYRGNATVLGVYMINYKQKGATLTGPGYAAIVTYWMPFFGSIGLHDASWRYRFGGEIYKRNGSHGCVNAPRYLAKTVFDNIEDGTPVIIYEEDN